MLWGKKLEKKCSQKVNTYVRKKKKIVLGRQIICTLIFNFVLVSFFFLSHCLCFLIKYSNMQRHTLTDTHTYTYTQHSGTAAAALRSLTRTSRGAALSRVARACYDVSLTHTHITRTRHIVAMYFARFSFALFAILPFFFIFSICGSASSLPLCWEAYVWQRCAIANEPANQNKKWFSVANGSALHIDKRNRSIT